MIKDNESDHYVEDYYSVFQEVEHEVRTFISIVLCSTDILARDDISERGKECLRILKQRGTGLVGLLDDAGELDSLNFSGFSLKNESFCIKEFLNEINLDLKRISDEQSVTLIYTLDNNSSELVQGDKVRIQQMLMSAFQNYLSELPNNGGLVIKLNWDIDKLNPSMLNINLLMSNDEENTCHSSIKNNSNHFFKKNKLDLLQATLLVKKMNGNIDISKTSFQEIPSCRMNFILNRNI